MEKNGDGFIKHTQLIHATQIMNWWYGAHIDDDFSGCIWQSVFYVPMLMSAVFALAAVAAVNPLLCLPSYIHSRE